MLLRKIVVFIFCCLFFVLSSQAHVVNEATNQKTKELSYNNLIPHGNFERDNHFKFQYTLEGQAQLSSFAPIVGTQSLLVNFTDFSLYSPLAYLYRFSENTSVKSFNFSGLIKMLKGADTESVIAEVHVTYHNDGKNPYTFQRTRITGQKNDVKPFNIYLSVDKTRTVKHVYLKFLYTKQEQDLSIVLDDIKLSMTSKGKKQLLVDADFERKNEFSFLNTSQGVTSLSDVWPITGRHSLLVHFTDFHLYNPLSYRYIFPENTYLNRLQFNGMMKIMAGASTEALIVEAHVTYHNNNQYPHSIKRLHVTGEKYSIEPFTVDLALDKRRQVKYVYLKFLSTQQQSNLSVLLDNLQLYLDHRST